MADGHGGQRDGAGRKRKSEVHAATIAEIERRVADRLPALVDRFFELAEGVQVQRRGPNGEWATDPEGEPRTYREPPDIKALTYLFDRILGKPTQAVEVAGDQDAPLKIVVEYADDPPPHHQAAPGAARDPAGRQAV